MAKYGVVLPSDLAQKIDAPLEYGDSRSQRIREMVRVGLAVEDELADHHMVDTIPEGVDRVDFVRSAINEKIERMDC